MLTKAEIDRRIKTQLAFEFNCGPDDFEKEETIITAPVLHGKRRKFSEKPFFLQMATFGYNAVISADERLHPRLREWVKGKPGFCLFDHRNCFALEKELGKFGYRMASPHHMFFPKPELMGVRTDLKIRWLEQNDIMPFYGNDAFPNALCDRFHPERPDVLAVIALDGEEIMGMAGCSADSPEMWQIGIDVIPKYQGRGVGKTLVSLLRDETFRRGAIPYYGTSLSNIRSKRTALSSGFVPAWIEAVSEEDPDGLPAK